MALNLLFPERNNSVWVCVLDRPARARPDENSPVVGKVRKGQHVFEVDRLQQIGRLWVAFHPQDNISKGDAGNPPNRMGSSTNEQPPQLCWVATNTTGFFMPVLERVEEEEDLAGARPRQVFDLDRRLSISRELSEVTWLSTAALSEAGRCAAANGDATGASSQRTAAAPSETDDGLGESDGGGGGAGSNNDNNDNNNNDDNDNNDDDDDDDSNYESYDDGDASAVHIGGVDARDVCFELSAIVAAIMSQVKDIVINYTASASGSGGSGAASSARVAAAAAAAAAAAVAAAAASSSSWSSPTRPPSSSFANLNTVDSMQASLAGGTSASASVGALWAHMDIINSLQQCSSQRQSVAFEAYMAAGYVTCSNNISMAAAQHTAPPHTAHRTGNRFSF